MSTKLGLADRLIGRCCRFKVPIEKVRTVFGANYSQSSNNHIKLTLEKYDRNRKLDYRETPLFDFLKNFSPAYLRDYVDGINTDLSLFDYPWGELVAGMAGKEMAGSRFCGPSTDEFIKEEYDRIIKLYEAIRNEGYRPKEVSGGYSAGTFLVNKSLNYRFIILQGNHRAPILAHLGLKFISVTLHPFFIKPLILESNASSWPAVKDGKCTVEDALKVFDLYFRD